MVVLRDGMCPGLSEEMVVALRAADITTVEDLLSSDTEDLAQKCSVSYKALLAVRRVLLAQHTAFPVSGDDLYEDLMSSTAIVSTGNSSLDKLLDSGLYTGELTELAGGPGSGKTQVCFGVTVNISYQLKQSVIYIDSTGGLSASRLLQILQKICKLEEQMEALQRIQVYRVFDIFSLIDCLQSLQCTGLQRASAGGGSVKAVIVDSVSAVISPILGGKQNEGTLIDFYCFIINLDCNGNLKAGLGQSWSHVPRTRIILQRFESPGSTCSSLRTATLAKSSRQPCLLKEEFDLQCWGRSEDQLYEVSGKRKLEKNSPY
uniref:RecA family profile 1 domain-containing protein n=1 Tax=Esox lucius TaxID=8010 RepID=A0A6Q2ZI02_ESOLU